MTVTLDLDKMSKDEMLNLMEQLQVRIEEKDESQLKEWQWDILKQRREDYLVNPEKSKPLEDFKKDLENR